MPSVIDGETGVLFSEQSPDSIAEAVKTFLGAIDEFEPDRIRANAERYSTERFRNEFRTLVTRTVEAYHEDRLRRFTAA